MPRARTAKGSTSRGRARHLVMPSRFEATTCAVQIRPRVTPRSSDCSLTPCRRPSNRVAAPRRLVAHRRPAHSRCSASAASGVPYNRHDRLTDVAWSANGSRPSMRTVGDPLNPRSPLPRWSPLSGVRPPRLARSGAARSSTSHRPWSDAGNRRSRARSPSRTSVRPDPLPHEPLLLDSRRDDLRLRGRTGRPTEHCSDLSPLSPRRPGRSDGLAQRLLDPEARTAAFPHKRQRVVVGALAHVDTQTWPVPANPQSRLRGSDHCRQPPTRSHQSRPKPSGRY